MEWTLIKNIALFSHERSHYGTQWLTPWLAIYTSLNFDLYYVHPNVKFYSRLSVLSFEMKLLKWNLRKGKIKQKNFMALYFQKDFTVQKIYLKDILPMQKLFEFPSSV